MFGVIAGLTFCLVAIFIGGGILTTLGDKIAHRSRLGHQFMGMVFLAAVTSLPELAAGLSAAGWNGQPDIAYGEVIGSCVFNLSILGVADLFSRRPVVASGGASAFLNGTTGIILLALAIFGLVGPGLAMGSVSGLSPIIIVVYLVGLGGARRADTHQPDEAAERGKGLTRLWLLFAATAVLVVGPGFWLPSLAASLAEQAGFSHSLVGTFLVGAFTSTPEIVVTYHAVRRGWNNMAVGNLLGSNLFNILILAPMDVVYAGGSIYEAAGGEHAVTALLAILMTAMVLAAGTWRSLSSRVPRWRPEGLVLLGLYVLAFLYLVG